MATAEKETKLLEAIAKLDTLLMAVKIKHPDFGFLWARDLLLQQAQCWLSLARLRRMSVAKALPHEHWSPRKSVAGSDNEVQGITECLARARAIYFDADAGKSKSFMQGQAAVLVEEAEVQVMRGQVTEAIATLDQAIQLCCATGDHAAESAVTDKLRGLRLELDTKSRLDELASDPQENASEREILQQCFSRLATTADLNGTPILLKDQLRTLAQDLGVQTPLQKDEVDEMWRQMHVFSVECGGKHIGDTGVSFSDVWRWWMAEEMFDFRRSHAWT